MNLPEPRPGLVVRYDFLWSGKAGRKSGTKDRPAVIALVVARGSSHGVALLPITHTPPTPEEFAVEIPPHEKHRLGLDDERSWVICTELNTDLWPEGLTPVPRTRRFSYGLLSAAVFREVLNCVREARRSGLLKQTER